MILIFYLSSKTIILTYENNLDFAIKKDKEDPLNMYRNEFLIPIH